MADPYRPSRDYREGYDEGYKDGFQAGWLGASAPQPRYPSGPGPSAGGKRGNPHTKKRRKTKSLLSEMAGKKWKTYKRKHPHGRKTYIQIRAEVSRSRAYKKRK